MIVESFSKGRNRPSTVGRAVCGWTAGVRCGAVAQRYPPWTAPRPKSPFDLRPAFDPL